MKSVPMWRMLCVVLTMGVAACSTLTDTLNERASGGQEAPEDAALRAEILDRLRDDPVTASHVFGVSVDQGGVVLRGWVPDDTIRLRAHSVVWSTPGVVRVEDRLSR